MKFVCLLLKIAVDRYGVVGYNENNKSEKKEIDHEKKNI